jgi:hypothetical protein
MEPANQEEVPKLSQVIQIDEGKIQNTWEKWCVRIFLRRTGCWRNDHS